MAKHQTPHSMRLRAAIGALIAGGMLLAGPACIGFAAPGTNNGDNGNHGNGNTGHGNGNSGQGNGPGNPGGGSGNPGNPGTPTDPDGNVGNLSGTSDFLLCGLDNVVATSCAEDPEAD
jgi:hypothetical protein